MQPPTPSLPAATAIRRRTAWGVQRGVLFALVMREMKARVGGQWVGAIWTLVEPLMHVLVILAIFSTIRSAAVVGVEIPVFLATGLLPFFLFQHLATRLMDGIDANRGLYAYRQVKPFDTLTSRAIVELLMNAIVYAVTLGLLGWLGYHVFPADPLEVLGVHALLFLIGFGFGTFAAVVSHDRPRIRSFIRISMMPMYIISGVIFPIHLAPRELLDWLLLNPLLHLIELSRHAFIPGYPLLEGVSLIFPVMCMLTLAALALALYRVNRLRLVTST